MKEENNFWTDELALEFACNLDELGKSIGDSKLAEFKKSKEKVIPKNWEILAFKQNSGIEDLWTWFGYGWCRNTNNTRSTSPYSTEEILNNSYYKIYSVKRLSDNSIWTIGDKFLADAGCDLHIESFQIIDDKWIKVWSKEYGYWTLNTINKPKVPLFTTEDGVDLPEGESYYLVHISEPYNTWKPIYTDCKFPPYLHSKSFSKRVAAEEYILFNKPAAITLKELNDYLALHGEAWVQKRVTEFFKSKQK